MIYGIGTDLVDARRVERLYLKYGERFAARILSEQELMEFSNSNKKVMFLSKRFAAKEALSKAFGTGLRYPVCLHYISVMHLESGKPYFEFNPTITVHVKNEGITNHHLSISDELNLACAFVILEKSS